MTQRQKVGADGRVNRVLELAEAWGRREKKWHRRLGWERAWDWIGAAVSPVVGAGAVLVIFLADLGGRRAALATALAVLITSLLGFRAYIGRQRLQAEQLEKRWAAADRLKEAYETLLVRLESGSDVEQVFALSARLEAVARADLPQVLQAELVSQARGTEQGND